VGTAFSDTLAQYAQEYMELEVLDAKMVEEDYGEALKQMESMNQQYKTVLDWYDRHETLQQAAAQLGVEQFAKEITLYLGGQENELTKMGIDQDTIDQFIEQSGLDLDTWKAGVEKENLEEVLEQSQEKIYVEQQKNIMEMATLLGDSTATYVGGLITWVQDNYGQPARTEIQQSIYAIHQAALQAIADGQDYAAIMEKFHASITDLLTGLGQD
jgi:sulfur transfer protein SufE